MPGTRKDVYVANKYCLELQHTASGWLHTAEGGMAGTEPINERMSGGNPVCKHAGNVKVEELTVTCGTAMSKQFYDWLRESINYNHERKEGAIITADYDYKEVVRQEFFEALIAEVGLPGVDASSKESCKFTVKLAPEYTTLSYSNGSKSVQPVPLGGMKQKRWQAANFKLSIDGMDCSRVSKVENLNIKQNIVDNTIGERLIFQKEPAQIDFPNVVFYLPEKDADPWYKWYDEFVCKGNSAPGNEKQGMLEYLTSDCAGVLFRVGFKNLGICKFTPDKLDGTTDKIRRVKIEMYCEAMDFEYTGLGLDGQMDATQLSSMSRVLGSGRSSTLFGAALNSMANSFSQQADAEAARSRRRS